MAQADLGLRLLLQDNASAGLGSFRTLLKDLISTAVSGSSGFTDLTSQIAAQDAAAFAAGEKVALYGSQLEAMAMQSVSADQAVTSLVSELAASGELGDVLSIQALIGGLSTTKMELANAQAQLSIWTEKLAESGGADAYAASQVSFFNGEVTRLEASVSTQVATIGTYKTELVGQAEALTNSQLAAEGLKEDMVGLSAGIQTASDAQFAATQTSKDLTLAQAGQEAQSLKLTLASGVLAGGAVGLGLVSYATDKLIQQSSGLQDAMANMTIAFHLTSKQADDMSNSLTSVASSSRFTEKDVADAFTTMAEYGQTAADVMGTNGTNGLGKQAINLAEAIGSQTVPAAQLLSQTMTVFGAKANEATNYTNLLDYAFYHGIPSVSGLTQVIQDVGGKASQTGATFDQLISVMDFLTRSGLSASVASTSLRYILSSFSNPTAAASKALTDIGIIAIHQTSPAFLQLQAALDSASGAAKKTAVPFDGTLTSLQNMFKQAQSLHVPMVATDKNFLQWAQSLGIVSNHLMDSNGKLKPLFTNIDQLGQAIKKLPKDQALEAIGAIFNVRSGQDAQLLLQNIDGVMAKLKQADQQAKGYETKNQSQKDANIKTSTLPGEMAKLNTTLSSFMAKVALPFTDWLAKVAGKMNELAGRFNGANPHVQTFAATFLKVAGILSAFVIVGGIVALIMLGIGIGFFAVAGIAIGLVITIGLVAAAAALIVAKWGAISGFFVGLWHTVSHAVVSGISTAINAIKSWIGQAGAWFQSLGHTALSGIQGGFNSAVAFVMHWGGTFRNAAVNGFNSTVAFVMHWGGTFRNSVVNGFNSAVAGLKNFGAGLLNGARSAFNSVFNFVGGLGANFHKAMGWMYNHNYYWKDMVDGAHTNLNKLNKYMDDSNKASKKSWDDMVKGVHTNLDKFNKNIDASNAEAQKNWNNFMNSTNQIVSSKMKEISTEIQNAWNGVVKWWNNGLDGQKKYWASHWADFVSECTSGMNGIRNGISFGWNWCMGYINMGIGAAKGLFNSLFGWIPGAASSAFNSASSGISSGMETAKGVVNHGINYINNLVGGWGATLQGYGNTAVKMFADGIRSGIGMVNDAVHSIGSSIWSGLGFHSPPKSGILSDSDQYMPNMMRMYGQGIRNNMHHVSGAVGDVASSIHKGFTTPMTQAQGTAYAASMAGGSSSSNPTTTVNLNMDGKVVGQVVIDRVSGQLAMNGIQRMHR